MTNEINWLLIVLNEFLFLMLTTELASPTADSCALDPFLRGAHAVTVGATAHPQLLGDGIVQ